MPQNAALDCHKTDGGSQQDMTFGFGNHFEKLFCWARAEGVEEALLVACYTLGLDERTVAVGNLVQEFSFPEASQILSRWGDNSVVQQLSRFVKAFRSSPDIHNAYAPVSHAGSADQNRRQFGDLEKRTYLLTLITNPLSEAQSAEGYGLRRMLRLWLVIQGAERIIAHQCVADANVSKAARFLILGGTDSERWGLIDQLLGQTNRFLKPGRDGFEHVTCALGHAVRQLMLQAGLGRSDKSFLSALAAVAEAQCVPLEQPRKLSPIGHELKSFRRPEPLVFTTDEDGLIYEYVPLAPDVGEEDAPAELVTVNPADSLARQGLATRSIFIQTAEASHYLPWSWDRPLPPEQYALERWIEKGLGSADPKLAVGAAFSWLATRFARSLSFVLRFQVGDETGDEWMLSTAFDQISRISPRRRNGWWPDSNAAQDVAPFSDQLEIVLPDRLSVILSTNAGSLAVPPVSLLALWESVSEEPIEAWFNRQATDRFPRLKSAKLAQVMPQQVYDRTGDYHLARMLSAHPNTGLPGACSYSAWDIAKIEKGLCLEVRKSGPDGAAVNLIGSLLDPLQSVLTTTIEAARKSLINARSHDLIEYHNQLAQYCVMALYAATGGRYLRDPFERLDHFNFEQRCLFINDKSDEGLHGGRLVPLPDQAIALVQSYLVHLRQVAEVVSDMRSGLSERTQSLTAPSHAAMPLFFLLDEDLKWHSMTDSHLPGGALFEWRLPSNLFRHRFAQQLLRSGIKQEIIDGWMGHAERCVTTYGDYSPRCWTDDADAHRDVINRLYEQLPFGLIDEMSERPALRCALREHRSSYSEPRTFGEQARQQQRRQALKRAIRIANDDIDLYLGRRSLSDLDPDATDRLGKVMLLREGHLTHYYAGVRFAVLLKRIEHSVGQKPCQIRRRLVSIQQERSLLTAYAVRALILLRLLQQWADVARLGTLKANLSKRDALAIGTILLCIEKRLSYQRLLADVMRGQHYRLVQHKQHYFFEYSEALEPDDYHTPVQRHAVSYKTASLLAHGAGIKQSIDLAESSIPEGLNTLPAELLVPRLGAPLLTLHELLGQLCRVMEQANLVSLPGMVAAVLSERTPATSLCWQDYLRMTEGRVVCLPGSDVQMAESLNEKVIRVLSGRALTSETDLLQANAHAFYQAITAELTGYAKGGARVAAKAIERLCQEHEGRISTSILMLGYWIVHVIRMGKGRGKSFKPFAKNTVLTYFSSMTRAFAGLAYDVDLLSLDGDEVTELYGDMLEFKLLRSDQVGYFGARLQAFQRWARVAGVADPDWSELGLGDDRRSVSPGVLSEGDYLSCQARIREQWTDPDQALMLGFTLLLTYRFGLRSQEAMGLRRKDWCEYGELSWVLVRNNRHRSLKSQSSRRAIPLLFELHPEEQALVEQILAWCDAIAGTAGNPPILCELVDGQVQATPLKSLIPTVLIEVMRTVTGNPATVLHHGRHSFYNRIAPILLGIDTPLARALTARIEGDKMRAMILGEQHEISRRCPMALSRLMGHQHPRTGMLNYNHLLTEWADSLTPVHHVRNRRLNTVLNTRDLQAARPPASSKLSAAALGFPKPTLGALLKTLRLVSQGQPYERAGSLNRVSPEGIDTLQHLFAQATSRMRFKMRGESDQWVEGKSYPLALIEYISDEAWCRMLALADRVGELDPPTHTELLALPDLPYLLSRNRHLLMSHPQHCELVKRVLDLFEVSQTQIHVVARKDDPSMTSLLSQYGFCVQPEARQKVQLDPFYLRAQGVADYRREYAGLILQRSREGILRNSHELAAALLVVGAQLALLAQTRPPVYQPGVATILASPG